MAPKDASKEIYLACGVEEPWTGQDIQAISSTSFKDVNMECLLSEPYGVF